MYIYLLPNITPTIADTLIYSEYMEIRWGRRGVRAISERRVCIWPGMRRRMAPPAPPSCI